MKTNNNINFKALPPCVRVVNKKILASRELSARELYQLRRENVRQIVDFRTKGKILQRAKEAIICFFLGIKRKSMPIFLERGLPSEQQIKHVEQFVDSSPSKTLFHCNGGFHRTNIFAQILQLRKGETTITEALQYLRDNGFFKIRKAKILPKEILDKRAKKLQEIFMQFRERFEPKTLQWNYIMLLYDLHCMY